MLRVSPWGLQTPCLEGVSEGGPVTSPCWGGWGCDEPPFPAPVLGGRGVDFCSPEAPWGSLLTWGGQVTPCSPEERALPLVGGVGSLHTSAWGLGGGPRKL